MKLRPVWCIHITAFVFSVLVLTLSAFSYAKGIILQWTSAGILTQVLVENGKTYLARTDDYSVIVRFDVRIIEPAGDEDFPYLYLTPEDRIDESLAVIQRLTGWRKNFEELQTIRLYVAPAWIFLLPPMAWLGGFYLVKLRRRIRAQRAGNQTLGKAV